MLQLRLLASRLEAPVEIDVRHDGGQIIELPSSSVRPKFTFGRMKEFTEICILGAGPTGLGAACALQELGCRNWQILESAPHAGGLAASFVDEQGFTWDIGGHVQFSHYEYFDRAMDEFLGTEGWLDHDRESWVWMRNQFIPYPLQNNIRRLPPADLERCLAGLVDITRNGHIKPANFRQWILATFGEGLADVFMFPYNFKVWAYPPELMSAVWVGERVAVTDLKRVLHNLVHGRDDVTWGPNNRFRFPKFGGTGAIWRACAERLPQERLRWNTSVAAVDLDRHQVTTIDGATFTYDTLISTIPLSELIRLSGQCQFEESAARGLPYSSSNIFGIGLRGKPREDLATKCWIYFPEDNCPFYRVTVFSNYSPNNVPDINRHWSLMAEVSESPHKPVDHDRLLELVIDGLLATRLIDAARILSRPGSIARDMAIRRRGSIARQRSGSYCLSSPTRASIPAGDLDSGNTRSAIRIIRSCRALRR